MNKVTKLKKEWADVVHFWTQILDNYILLVKEGDQPKIAKIIDVADSGRVLVFYPAQECWEDLVPGDVLAIISEDSANMPVKASKELATWKTELRQKLDWAIHYKEIFGEYPPIDEEPKIYPIPKKSRKKVKKNEE